MNLSYMIPRLAAFLKLLESSFTSRKADFFMSCKESVEDWTWHVRFFKKHPPPFSMCFPYLHYTRYSL